MKSKHMLDVWEQQETFLLPKKKKPQKTSVSLQSAAQQSLSPKKIVAIFFLFVAFFLFVVFVPGKWIYNTAIIFPWLSELNVGKP